MWPNNASRAVGLEIGACGRVGRYFPKRLPSEGRSERGFCWCAHRPKWRLPEKVAGDECGLSKLTTQRNPNPSILKLFYDSDTMLREIEYSNSH